LTLSYFIQRGIKPVKNQSSIKRSRIITLALISSISLVACGEETQPTQRAVYASRAECEREWGIGDDRCYSSAGYHYGPHFIYLGGRGYYYPYQAGGVPSASPSLAPNTANFSSGAFRGTGVVTRTGISRGGFGSRGGFFSRGFGG
jgi:hypothetical protein